MNRTKRLSQFITATSTALAVVAAQQTSAWTGLRALPRWVPPAIAVILVALLMQLLRNGLELTFDSSRILRRLFLGKQLIEGTWLDLLKRGTDPVGYGFSRLEYDGSSVRLGGEDFLLDGTAQGHYQADLVELEWPKIRYKYTYQSSADAGVSSQGYGEAQFIERDGPPTHYVGFFFDLVEGKRISFEGWRVTDRALLSELDDVAARRSAIVAYFAKYLERSSSSA